MLNVDSETLFNTAAAVVTVIAVAVFVLSVEFPYSPVSRLLLVVVFLAGVFALTQRTDDGQLTLLGYGVVVTSVVVLFFETVSTFSAGDTVTVLGLLGIAAVLFGARRSLDEENHFVSGRRATVALGVVAALAVAVLAVDVATGGLAYELRTAEAVEVPETQRDEARVGTLVVENPTPLPERVETPEYGVCAAGNWSRYRPDPDGERPRPPVHTGLNVQDGYDEHVTSFGTKRYPVVLYLDGERLAGEQFPVRRTDGCPDGETGEPYLAVFESPPEGRLTPV